MARQNVYVHFPFCRSRCAYCDFYSTLLGADVQHRYVDALCREAEARISGEVQHVYVGGGTPSLMCPDDMGRLMGVLSERGRRLQPSECTIEANPDDISADWLRHARTAGFNRVSLGVQSFNDDVLRFVGRRHSATAARKAAALALDLVGNVSIDLIYGLPLQTVDDFRRDVETAIAMGVPHISAYALTYEEGTRLWRLRHEGSLTETSDEAEWEMYDLLMNRLADAGYEHYEISNFAKPGYVAKHNSGYWDGTFYVGLGAAAHSYDGACRRWNVADVAQYVAADGQPSFELEMLTDQMRYEELLMTRLRTRRGLRLADVPEPFRPQLDQKKVPHLAAGNLEEADGTLRLTRKGLFRSDDVLSDLF